jgi:hypothetical protein
MIEEESPIGTPIGNIKDILSMINNNSQLMNRIEMKFTNNNDTQVFHLNSSTGLIRSNSRLDYEEKSFYSFSILFEPIELNCSLFIRIQLINIDDNPILFDQNSLNYTIDDNHLLPFYLGRIRLMNSDLFQYRYFLKNSSLNISIDSMTGSIILLTKINHDQLQYEIIAMNSLNRMNITDILRINIHHLNEFIPLKNKDLILNIDTNKDSNYFNLDNLHRCIIDKNQLNGTNICTIGKNSMDFIYQLIDPMDLFDILSNNGTILNRKIFNHQIDNHEFNVTIIVRDRKNQVMKILTHWARWSPPVDPTIF